MSYHKLRRQRISPWMLAAALLPAIVAGCSRPMAKVSGKVTYQGNPLPAGSVTFVHADGTTVSGAILEGDYSISKVPAGQCTALVVSSPPRRSLGSPSKNQPGKGGRKAIPIPPRYSDPKQSDLHYEFQSGSQTCNIELK